MFVQNLAQIIGSKKNFLGGIWMLIKNEHFDV